MLLVERLRSHPQHGMSVLPSSREDPETPLGAGPFNRQQMELPVRPLARHVGRSRIAVPGGLPPSRTGKRMTL
jgi:hypothetical protein